MYSTLSFAANARRTLSGGTHHEVLLIIRVGL